MATKESGKSIPPAVAPGQRFGDADGPPETVHVDRLHAPVMREKEEPRDGSEPVPLWLVAFFGALLFWGGWYISEFSGGWRADILDERPEARFAYLMGTATGAAAADPMVLGERLYKANCVACHQADGQGVPGQYPPLAASEWVLERPEAMRRILLHGVEGNLTVRGNVYNGNMPGFGARLDDAKLAAVLTYVRGSWGNAADPISAESVAASRTATAGQTKPWNEAALMGIEGP